MELFRRFSSGLFNPRDIGSFSKDKKRMTFFFFIVLLFISIIPHTLTVAKMKNIPYAEQIEIKRYFKSQDEIPFIINDYKLINVNNTNDYKAYPINSQLIVIFSPNTEVNVGSRTAFVFTEDAVNLQVNILKMTIFKYTDYEELENINFKDARTDSNQFWDTIFQVANTEYQKYLPMIKIGLIIGTLISNTFSFLFFSLLIAFFQRRVLLPRYTFGKVWQLSIYCIVPYVFGTVLATLFNFEILSLIGLIMMIIYGALMSQSLIKESR